MAVSKFDRDEIERERKKALRRNQNLDEEKLRQKARLRLILERGTLSDLNEYLLAIGKADDAEAQALVAHFRRVRGL